MGYVVISRRLSERITIGDKIEILIANIRDGRVDVAIRAPKELSIRRVDKGLQERSNGHSTRNKFRPGHKRD